MSRITNANQPACMDAGTGFYQGYISTNPVTLGNAAREHIRKRGHVPIGYLRNEVEQSWRRSLQAGVDCDTTHFNNLDEISDLTEFLANSDDLLQCATPELDQLHQNLDHRDAIVLADADARIIELRGSANMTESKLGTAIRAGVSWRENLLGTNALGTAIYEKRPIQILQGEHYLGQLSVFSCYSTPIYDAQGNLTGALNLSRYSHRASHRDSQSLVKFAARNIESRLFCHSHRKHCILAFHSNRHYLRSSLQGLIAMDEQGCILAINDTGWQLLEQPRDQLLGKRLQSALPCSLDEVLSVTYGGKIAHYQLANTKLYIEFAHFGEHARSRSVFIAPSSSTTSAPKPSDSMTLVPPNIGYDSLLKRPFHIGVRSLSRSIPVLLLGETGTGKEVAARNLHQASNRAQKPFVAINCAAIPENLIESELFGYREGAFTGSRKGGMKGRLEQANGGTLFLDEIGDMPLDLQARLLRVLQERQIHPLGSSEQIELDIQIVAATHRTLKTMVKDGQFREDLYYRLNGVTITLPPLRERKDLLALINHLIQSEDRSHVEIAPDLLKRLKSYHWPGNIRQLETVIKVALAIMDEHEHTLGNQHLTPDFLEELGQSAPKSGLLQENESTLIRQALEKHNGNVSAAASALGIGRATLYRKLRECPDIRS